jgi:hypothetical protein
LVPVVDEAHGERGVVNRAGKLDTNLDHSIPVAELLFGKQGPPPTLTKLPSTTAQTSSTSRLVKPLTPQTPPQATIPPPSILNTTAKEQFVGQLPLPESAQTTSSATNSVVSNSQANDVECSLSSGNRVYEVDGDEFRIPLRQQYDKLRRFLSGPSDSSVIVSMYGAIEGVNVSARQLVFLQPTFLAPALITPRHWLVAQGPSPTKEAVDDACLVTHGNRSSIVLGHGRDDQQLSLINIDDTSNGVSLLSSYVQLPDRRASRRFLRLT